jgi:hypothetical protein
MAYNLTGLENVTNAYTFVTGVNTLTEQYFAILLLFTIFVAIFALLKRYETSVVIITASFITSLLSLMFWSMQWIKQEVIIVPLILLFSSIMFKLMAGD